MKCFLPHLHTTNLAVKIVLSVVQMTSLVYERENCVGESKLSWNSRGAEHDPGCACNSESAIKQHDESTDRNIHLRDACVHPRTRCDELSQEIFLES